jgi:hypothetical protein
MLAGCQQPANIINAQNTQKLITVINWKQTVHLVGPIIPSFQMVLQPGVGLGLLYNMPPGLSIPCSVSPFIYSLSQLGNHCVPRLIIGFRNNSYLQGEVVSLKPNPQPGGPGYPLLSGPSPSTCPARVAVPVANATAGIALRISWPRKIAGRW